MFRMRSEVTAQRGAINVNSSTQGVLKESVMTRLEIVLYTAKVHATGGRDGASRSDDGRLDIKLSTPGTSGVGTNPEQLFAAAWSASLIGAMKIEAGKMNITVPAELAVNAEVDLGTGLGAYALAVHLNVSLPGIERALAKSLVEAAHRLCPYSRATHGNIEVETNLV
jgi:osmotically inducible protein OsmC